MLHQSSYNGMANSLRFLAIDAVNKANSGHPGMPMGMADIATVLFSEFMNFNPKDPLWPNRDRFIMSNGHGSMLQYGLLHLLGYDLSLDDIKNFRQSGSKTPGHPEYGHTVGIETTTGPLGQGLATAIGIALSQKIMGTKFGKDKFNNTTYVTVGDGCLMEGISHESAEIAARLNLDNLIVLFDSNGISIDGKTDITSITNITGRFASYGWETIKADGHDHQEISDAIAWAKLQNKPVLIEFKTHIGFGSTNLQDTAKAHGSPVGEEEAQAIRKHLNWEYPPFEIPKDIRKSWEMAAKHGKRNYTKTTISNNINLLEQVLENLDEIKIATANEKPKLSTRQASGNCIDVIMPLMETMVSGSADLTGSNNTQPKNYRAVTADDYNGNYIHYGVREHAMGAIMNGLTLGGIRAISGTFLVFADYLRPSLRLSALMGLPVVHVLTHDSIGLGEDGPTHQPIEHLAMLRATPNLTTWRPADLVETAECWQTILQQTNKPAALALSRQGLPTIRTKHSEENLSAKGGYILRREQGELQGIFLATGSEVHLAVGAYDALKKENIHTRVVSLPSVEVFLSQDNNYRDSILPPEQQNRVVVEAASHFGWHALAPQGKLLCLYGFGASAPATELYEKFGITAHDARNAMIDLLAH